MDDALGVEHVWEAPLAAPGLSGARVVLAANLTRPLSLSVADLGAACGALRCPGAAPCPADVPGRGGATRPAASVARGRATKPTAYVARAHYAGTLRVVDATSPLSLVPNARPASCAGRYERDYCVGFEVWTLTPLESGQRFALLGELDKVVAVSPQRFASVAVGSRELAATVTHAPNETVRLGVAIMEDGAPTALLRVECGPARRSRLGCGEDSCSCEAIL